MATMTPGLSAFAGALAVEREEGLVALRRALPMPKGADVVAKAVTAVLCVAFVVPVLIALGLSIGNADMSFATITAVWALAVLGSIPFCALGAVIGVHASARAVPAIVNVVMIPMLYLSGALFPLPESLAWVRHFTLPFHLQQLMLATAGIPTPFVIRPFTHAAVLLAAAVICVALSLRRFRISA